MADWVTPSMAWEPMPWMKQVTKPSTPLTPEELQKKAPGARPIHVSVTGEPLEYDHCMHCLEGTICTEGQTTHDEPCQVCVAWEDWATKAKSSTEDFK